MSGPPPPAEVSDTAPSRMWLVFDGPQPVAFAAETVLAIEPDAPGDALELWPLLGLDATAGEPPRLARIASDGAPLLLRVHARPRLVELPQALVLDVPSFLRRDGAARWVAAVATPPQGPPIWVLDRTALLRVSSAQPGVPT